MCCLNSILIEEPCDDCYSTIANKPLHINHQGSYISSTELDNEDMLNFHNLIKYINCNFIIIDHGT